MNCPHCGRDFDPVEGQAYCHFCGGALKQADSSVGPQRPDAGPDGPDFELQFDRASSARRDEYCPWEDQENLGFGPGIYRTVKGSLFSPEPFFARLPLRRGLLLPLLYALIIQTVGTMVSYLWAFALGHPLLEQLDLSGDRSIYVGAAIPVLVFMGIVLWALALHAALFLVGWANEDFEATFRVSCYSSAPELLNAIPYFGGLVALFWRIYITVVGIREVHRVSTGKALAGVLIPFVVCCGLIFGAMTLLAIGLGLSVS